LISFIKELFSKEFFTAIKKRYQLIIGIIILLFAFLISRLPYFLYFPIVGYHPDTAVYFTAIEGIYSGQLPKFGVVPPLYPLFLWLTGLVSSNILIIAIVQTIMSIFSALLLIYNIYKYLKSFTIAIAISLSAFFMTGNSITFDSMIMTESFYTSSIIVIFAVLIKAVFSNNKSAWIFVSVTLTIPFLLRPNGVITFLFLFLILIFLFINKLNKNLYYYTTLPFLSIIITWLIYNFISSGSILPDRLMTYFNLKKIPTYQLALQNYQGETKPYTEAEWKSITLADTIFHNINSNEIRHDKRSKVYRFLVFLNAISYESRPYYTSEMYRRYTDFYIKRFIERTYHNNSFNIAPFSEQFKKRMFKNYYLKLPTDNFYQKADIQNNSLSLLNKSVIYNIYNFIYNYLILTFFKNKIWIFLSFLSFLLSCIRLIKSRFTDKTAFIIVFIVSFLYVTDLIMCFTGHNTGSWRYTYPTEFIFFISGVLLIYFINFKTIKNKIFK